MQIETIESMIDYSKFSTWYDDRAEAAVMDIDDVKQLAKEYAAQFIDLAVSDIHNHYEGEYGIDEIVERIKLIKKQIK